MKKFFLSALVIPFLLTSCSTDELTEQSLMNNTENSVVIKEFESPAFDNNPYDKAGRLYRDIKNEVLAQNIDATLETISANVDLAADNNVDFSQISGTYTSLDNIHLGWVINNNENGAAIINNLSASAMAKQRLEDFILLYNSLEGEEYSTAYNAITQFEQGIINSSDYTSLDKQIILITTSVARYQQSYKDKSITRARTGLYGAMTGANSSVPMGITMAAAATLIN